MKDNNLVNVVIPVYNTEKYLDNCLTSLLNQTYPDWHAVIVDDGSTDDSAVICKKFVRKYPRKFDFYSIPNSGPGGARNYGIEHSAKDAGYWFFLDSDDFIDKDTLSKLVYAIKKDNSDMAVCGYVRHNGKRETNISYYKSGVIGRKEVIESLLTGDEIGSFSCNKLFSYRLFELSRYPEKCFYEDVALFYKIVLKCNSISVIRDTLYHYVWHKTSVVASIRLKQIADLKKTINDRDLILEKQFPELANKILFNKLIINIHIWNRFCKICGKSAIDKASEELEFILKHTELFYMLDKKNKIMARIIKISPKIYAELTFLLKNFFFLK